ncbi:MAG: hypothetical protein ACW96N_02240 [Candidatus Thorarchaeota archaeon]
MPSLESSVMQSFALSCEVIKDTVVNNIHAAAARGDFELTNDAFAKIDALVKASVDQAARNSARQMQSALKQHG